MAIKFWLLALVVWLVAVPVRADIRGDLVRTLEQTRAALGGDLDYARYLQEAGRVTTALDTVIYSKTKVPPAGLATVKFVNKQLRGLEEAWALRYRVGVKNINDPNVVGFYRSSLPRVTKAFAAVDPALRLGDYQIETVAQPGQEEYRTYAYDRLIRNGFSIIARNIDTALTRLR